MKTQAPQNTSYYVVIIGGGHHGCLCRVVSVG